MRDKLRWFHRWVGIPLGIMFFVTLASGALTAFHQVRINMDDRGQTYRVTSGAENAAAVEFITSQYTGLSTIVLPSEAKPYYQAKIRGDRALIGIADAQGEHAIIQGMENSRGPVFAWVLNLHRSYLLGRANQNAIGVAGAKITAWMSLTAVFVSLLGLYLWWPFRSKFKVKQAVPMSNKRRAYFNAHLTSGLIVVGAIVILGMSGASLYFRTQAGAVLGNNAGQEVGVLERPETLPDDWAVWVETAALKIPDGKLKSIDFPRGAPPGGAQGGGAGGFQGGPQAMGGNAGRAMGGVQRGEQGNAQQGNAMGGFQRGQQGNAMGGVPGGGGMGGPGGGAQAGPFAQALSFSFVTHEDWLSVPNSRVYINQAASELVGVKRFGQNTFGQKLYAMLNPLHTGNNITPAYIFVMMLMAGLAAIMILSGVVSMLWNLLKKKREDGSVVILSKGKDDKLAQVTIRGPAEKEAGEPKGAPAE